MRVGRDLAMSQARLARCAPGPAGRAPVSGNPPQHDWYDRKGLDEGFVPGGLLEQKRRRSEPFAIGIGQGVRARCKIRRANHVDELQHTASPARIADPENGSDIRVPDGFDHALFEDADRLDGLDIEQAVFDILDVDLQRACFEMRDEARPKRLGPVFPRCN